MLKKDPEFRKRAMEAWRTEAQTTQIQWPSQISWLHR